jgi:hypothetical protein
MKAIFCFFIIQSYYYIIMDLLYYTLIILWCQRTSKPKIEKPINFMAF